MLRIYNTQLQSFQVAASKSDIEPLEAAIAQIKLRQEEVEERVAKHFRRNYQQAYRDKQRKEEEELADEVAQAIVEPLEFDQSIEGQPEEVDEPVNGTGIWIPPSRG